MRIIKDGTDPDTIEYKCTCKKCKTVFAFRKSETRLVDDDRNGAAHVVKCPKCSTENWIDTGALTPVREGE